MELKLSQSKAMPLGEIIVSSYRFRPRDKRVKSNVVMLDSVKFSDSAEDKVPYLIAKSSVQGESGLWRQTMHLINPTFHPNRTNVYTVNVELRGVDVWMRPFDANTPCRLNCTCPDHRHRFHWNNADVKSHVGKRIPYQKKTDRPPVNPDYPGHCKHLIGLIEYLSTLDVVDPSLVRLNRR